MPTKRVPAIIVNALLCGLLLMAFVMIGSLMRYVFSLGALYLGFKFFGQFEDWGSRFWLIGLSFFCFLLFLTLYVLFAIPFGWPLPDGVEVTE